MNLFIFCQQILKYIEESITGKGFPLHNQVYPPGLTKIKVSTYTYVL